MNLRLACDLCGSQPCMCVEAECARCSGLGEWDEGPLPARSPVQESPDYNRIICPDCEGSGWIKCDGPRSTAPICRFESGIGDRDNVPCYCEAAWERQQEANASEPPMSADERHALAWRQKQELRR